MAFAAAPVLPSATLLRRPELESDPERSVAMDSALSDPHNGSAEAGGAANGTTRPPSTPEGIALAYGSLLLMALLPIFFGALRSVRCARGKVGSETKPRALSTSHPDHDRRGPFPAWITTTSPSRATSGSWPYVLRDLTPSLIGTGFHPRSDPDTSLPLSIMLQTLSTSLYDSGSVLF